MVQERGEFHPDTLPILFDALRLGQFYETWPAPRRADAFIRAGARVLLLFRFIDDPLDDEEEAEKEIKGYTVEGWLIVMVLVCTASDDYFRQFWGAADGFTSLHQDLFSGQLESVLVALSSKNVQEFAGSRHLEAAVSSLDETLALDGAGHRKTNHPPPCGAGGVSGTHAIRTLQEARGPLPLLFPL